MRFVRGDYAGRVRDNRKTTMRVTRFVRCPFSAAIEFAEETLRHRTDFTISAAPAVAHHVTVAAHLAEDVSDTVRRHEALLIAWKPRLRLFPPFAGALTVRPKGRGTWLRIQGSYEPPLGAAGRLFDAIAGRFIARLTLQRLLGEIARGAEERWRAFKAELPA